MIPFKTTAEEIIRLSEIVVAMRDAGISREFIRGAHALATKDQGVFDLMQLWSTAETDDDRKETIADIQEIIDEVAERSDVSAS